MNATPQLPLRILTAALVLAVAADLLLRGDAWGAGFTLWSLLVIGFVVWFDRGSMRDPARRGFALLVAGTALMPAFRDSVPLTAANILATLGGISILLLSTPNNGLAMVRFLDLLWGSVLHVGSALIGAPLLCAAVLPRSGTGGRAVSRLLPVLRGCALALPAVLLFGSLLAAADAGFEALVRAIIWIDLAELFGHLAVVGAVAWIAAGLLRGRLLAPPVSPAIGSRPAFFRVGMVEGGILLAAVDLLFAAYVALQFPYFFGGHQTVLATPALTLAEYASRGFFELVAIVLFAIPLLLGTDWLVTRTGRGEERGFIGLVAATGLLLGAVAASAVWRLLLYVEAFGLTLARVNAAAVLLWLLIVLLFLVLSVASGRRERFLFRAIASGYALLLLLNLMNPEELILRVNLDRAARGGDFDVAYVRTLGADGIPHLRARLEGLPEAARREIEDWLRTKYGGEAGPGFREWNYGLERARTGPAGR